MRSGGLGLGGTKLDRGSAGGGRLAADFGIGSTKNVVMQERFVEAPTWDSALRACFESIRLRSARAARPKLGRLRIGQVEARRSVANAKSDDLRAKLDVRSEPRYRRSFRVSRFALEEMTSAPAITDDEDHPLIGQTLRGTYRILSALDQGGMGLVFEAEHTRLRRRVAVKVLARHLTSDTQALARFNREAEIISQLEHPHIVQILDFDTTEQGEPYIVMELLKGESLSDRLEREGCLSIEDSARIALQVASGLFAAHQASIVHRDLKPANIFLSTMPGQGGGRVVKLLDFGISKRVGVGRSLTGEFDVLGTPDYMAPEQALGKTASVDHRGDQYALAVIAFEMLSGQTPFSGSDLMDVLQKVVSVSAPPIERFAPHVSPLVGTVLKRGLEKDPAARYPTVLDFALAFSAACESSQPTPASGRAGQRAHRARLRSHESRSAHATGCSGSGVRG